MTPSLSLASSTSSNRSPAGYNHLASLKSESTDLMPTTSRTSTDRKASSSRRSSYEKSKLALNLDQSPLDPFEDSAKTPMLKKNAQASNHIMKSSKRGRPFIKDVHDLFSTLIISLNLETHRQFFKQYHNAFTTDEACLNLSSLKFSQSNRSGDPENPSRIITTTTTTTFTMSREMAKDMCQHFIHARLIENAVDPANPTFKDKGIYVCTPKGLHILERFVAKNGISQQHLLKVFASQEICMKLLHLERKMTDDDLYTSRAVVEMLWRRFVGRKPNRPDSLDDLSSSSSSSSLGSFQIRSSGPPSSGPLDQMKGIALIRFQERIKGHIETFEYTVRSHQVIGWLLDFTTMAQKEEAAEIAAQFVKYGFLELIYEKEKPIKPTTMRVVVEGREDEFVNASGEFRDKAIYKVTDRGMQIVHWKQSSSSSSFSSPQPSESSKENPYDDRFERLRTANSNSQLEMDDLEVALKSSAGFNPLKESHTTKLQQILEEPSLRSSFREFLRTCFCEENLNYWLDVQELRKRFSTCSSAAAGPAKSKAAVSTTMEKHHRDLVAVAFMIYNTYLALHSLSELNIDHTLRGELVSYVNKNLSEQAAAAAAAALSKSDEDAVDLTTYHMQASQLQTLLVMYERIQMYIFRLMATDSVPKFCKTDKFTSLITPTPPSSDCGSIASMAGSTTTLDLEDKFYGKPRAYLTISQAANEKYAAAAKHTGSS